MIRTLTTVPLDLPPLRAEPPAHWPAALEVLDRRRLSRSALLRRLLESRHGYDALLLNGSGRFDQVAAALVIRDPAHVPVVVSDCTWHDGTSFFDRLACRIGIRLLDDPDTTFCVLSTDETRLFPETWRVNPRQVVFTPFCHTLSTAQLAAPVSADLDVFAGGDSMRDYAPLLEAARRLGVHVRLAARTAIAPRELPPNVHVGAVSPDGFFDLLRRARVIVVPLRAGICRSAGQQTYLNAMALGKLVIVTDSPGARDYIEHGVDGLIVPPGDPEALASALAWAFHPQNAAAVHAIATRARQTARQRFSPTAHIDSLLRIVERAVASSRRARGAVETLSS